MNNFPFSSVRSALEWYFRKAWIKPPIGGGSLPVIKVQSSPKNDNAEIVFRAHQAIKRSLDRLAPRDWCIVAAEFGADPHKQADLADRYDLMGGSRSVRFIRDRALKRIEQELTDAHVISRGRPEEPQYARPEE